MPDTKSGRERKGRNKMAQLVERLNQREIETLDQEDEPPEVVEPTGDFLAEEPVEDL